MGTVTSTSTLAPGASRTFNLAPASAVSLTLLPNCRVTVTETPAVVASSPVGGNAPRTHNLRYAGVVTYGPYAMGGTIVVSNDSNSGSTLTWTRTDSLIAEDASGISYPVSPDGISLGLGSLAGVTNSEALRPWFNALADAAYSPAIINHAGDSTVFGLYGDGTNTNTDAAQAQYSIATQLAQLFNAALGMPATYSITAVDGRVTASNANAVTSVGLVGRARQVSSSGPGTLTFTLPACTSVRIHYYEHDGSSSGPATGSFSYNIDAAGAVSVTNGGAVNTYKSVTVSGLANTSHTLVITGTAAGQAYIDSVDCWTGGGVLVARHGVGGYTSSDMLGKGSNNNIAEGGHGRTRLLTAFSKGQAPLTAIQCGHNDGSQQNTANQLTTPAVYQANLSAMAAQCSLHGGAVLLISQPDPNNSDASLTYKYRDYWEAARALAVPGSNIAHISIADFWGNFAAAKAAGYCNDTSGVHPLRRGYGSISRLLFRALMSADGYRARLVTGA